MGQIIAKELLDRLVELAGPFAQLAVDEARGITQIDTDDADSIEGAVAVNAATLAITAILQTIPLTEFGAVVALASAYGTTLGSADVDRARLHAAFQAQTKATMREIAAARMPTVGNA